MIFSCDVFLWSRGKNLMLKKRKTVFSCCDMEEPRFEEEKGFVEVNTATKTKGTNNMELMESTVKVDMEINYGE